jgi:hypothetical protein
VRYIVLALTCVLITSCRDIESPAVLGGIDGYELSGKITTSSGIPVDSVSVSLFYYYEYISNRQLDTIPIIITDTAQVLDVTILSNKFKLIHTLFHGRFRDLGPIQKMFWNGRDDNNKPVPSGLYYMSFSIDSVFVKRNSIIVDGNVTAYTDLYGRFTLMNNCLPVGQLFDAYNDDGSYYGVLKVEPKIALTLSKGGSHAEYESIHLSLNSITKLALTLN